MKEMYNKWVLNCPLPKLLGLQVKGE